MPLWCLAKNKAEENMKKVVVTGAGGFIGSHLTEAQLGKDRSVIAFDKNLDRLSHLKADGRCQLIEGDIRDRESVAKLLVDIDCIFHLASAHLEVNQDESYYWETNVKAVRQLLELARANNVKRYVHCSSVGVYGKLDKLPADEKTPCNPEILYERTKLAGEVEVRKFYESYGFPVVIIRPAWVYGPRCPRTLKLFRTIYKKRFLMVGTCRNYRHPVFITDMLKAFELAALDPDCTGEALNIAASDPVMLKDLVRMIADIQSVDLPPVTVPLWLMKPIAAIIENICTVMNREPPFSRRSLKVFTESSAYDISKARDILHFEPEVDLQQGLMLTHKWFLDNGLL
jgi:nucleoside-diphosphate-sugar epimerase